MRNILYIDRLGVLASVIDDSHENFRRMAVRDEINQSIFCMSRLASLNERESLIGMRRIRSA